MQKKIAVPYEFPSVHESKYEMKKRRLRIKHRLLKQRQKHPNNSTQETSSGEEIPQNSFDFNKSINSYLKTEEEGTQIYSVLVNPEDTSASEDGMTQNYSFLNNKELELMSLCEKYNVKYDFPTENETSYDQSKRRLRLQYRIKCRLQTKPKNYLPDAETELLSFCRKFGATYEQPTENESKYAKTGE